jgi:hypothetical protein
MTKSSVPPENIRRLSALLFDVRADFREKERVSVGDLLEAFHERGFGFFLFLFALPAVIPLPPMGISIITGVPLLLLTLQQMLGFHTIWVPEKIRRWHIDKPQVDGFIAAAVPWCRRMERFIKPRWGALTQGFWSHVIGMLGFVMALAVILPIPFTNNVPAIGIVFMSVGILMRDGLAVMAGAVIGGVWSFGLFFLLIFFGIEGLNMAGDALLSIF